MSNFSIDIEKYYEELSTMSRQLKGVFCIQYPIYCIHSEISDSTPDPLDNLDKVIVDFVKVKADFSPFHRSWHVSLSFVNRERMIFLSLFF